MHTKYPLDVIFFNMYLSPLEMKDWDEREQDLYNEPKEELKIIIRADLARAFRRCVWMEVNETGLSPYEVQNLLIEELLKNRGC